jgi:hypothetical protein
MKLIIKSAVIWRHRQSVLVVQTFIRYGDQLQIVSHSSLRQTTQTVHHHHVHEHP